MITAGVDPLWDRVVGQPLAVEQLRLAAVNPVHAFLLVGPEGCGKEEAARALAGSIIAGAAHPSARDAQLAADGRHPDIHEIVREGASISADQARDVISEATLTPTEGPRKVIILHEVDLMGEAQIVRLLKTVEEPSPGVHFILLAEALTESLVTFNSRAVTVNFGPLRDETVTEVLIAEGVAPETARVAASSSHGSLSRARLLASDAQLVKRHEFFVNIPRRIDGSGATALAIVEQILEMLDDAVEPMKAEHENEIAELEQAYSTMGVKRSAKRALEDRHKREVRRHRTDELRAGLTAVAGVYRDELARNNQIHRPEAYAAAVSRLHKAMDVLSLNVNEAILLRDLIWSLPSPSADATLQFVLAEATK